MPCVSSRPSTGACGRQCGATGHWHLLSTIASALFARSISSSARRTKGRSLHVYISIEKSAQTNVRDWSGGALASTRCAGQRAGLGTKLIDIGWQAPETFAMFVVFVRQALTSSALSRRRDSPVEIVSSAPLVLAPLRAPRTRSCCSRRILRSMARMRKQGGCPSRAVAPRLQPHSAPRVF